MVTAASFTQADYWGNEANPNDSNVAAINSKSSDKEYALEKVAFIQYQRR